MQKVNTCILFSFFAMLLLVSCEQIEKTKSAVETAETYANKIMDSEMLPAANEDTLTFFKELTSQDSTQRVKAFDYYLKLRDFSDGALGEVLTGYVKSYFWEQPQEFLKLFNMLSEEQKSKIIDDVAFEYYASGLEGKNDLLTFIQEIRHKCKDCDSMMINMVYQKLDDRYNEVNE